MGWGADVGGVTAKERFDGDKLVEPSNEGKPWRARAGSGGKEIRRGGGDGRA